MTRRLLPRGAGGPAAFAFTVLLSVAVLFSPGSDVPSGVPISDKLVHALLFAALAASGVAARLPVRALAPGLLVYAVLSEVLQATLPIQRDGDWRDALADVLGVLAGLTTALVVRRSGWSQKALRGSRRTP